MTSKNKNYCKRNNTRKIQNLLNKYKSKKEASDIVKNGDAGKKMKGKVDCFSHKSQQSQKQANQL